METKHYDLIVFGGGNAISTAIDCGAAGMKVALIERGPLGGTCPHRGCIPSKLLIGYADAAEHARDARRFGFETTLSLPDPDAILRDTFDFTGKYDGILNGALGKNVTLYRGEATFVADRTLMVSDSMISCAQLVLATGSRPRRPENSMCHSGPATTFSDSARCRSPSPSLGAVTSRASWDIFSTEWASTRCSLSGAINSSTARTAKPAPSS